MQLFRSGAFSTDNPADIISLWGWTSAGGRYFTFFNTATRAAYQVTSGKTFRMTRMWWVNQGGAGTDCGITLGTSTASVGQDSASTPTGWTVVAGGASSGSRSGFMVYEYFNSVTNRAPIAPTIECMLAFPSATPGYYISATNVGDQHVVYMEGFES